MLQISWLFKGNNGSTKYFLKIYSSSLSKSSQNLYTSIFEYDNENNTHYYTKIINY